MIGRCSKCNAAFKISKCAVTANVKVIIEDGNSKEFTMMIFKPILSGVVAGISGRSLDEKLLRASSSLN